MRQMKNEIIVDFSSGGFMDEATARDEAPGEKLYEIYEGENYPVRSLELYEKLIQLPYARLVFPKFCQRRRTGYEVRSAAAGKADVLIADQRYGIHGTVQTNTAL